MSIKSIDVISNVTEYEGIWNYDIIWGTNVQKFKERTREVLMRAPLAIEYENEKNYRISKFQFYDIEVITLANGEKYYSEPINYSPIYYTGKRLSVEEINKNSRCECPDSTVTSVITYSNGYENIVLRKETEGITIEEYKQQLKEKNDTPKKTNQNLNDEKIQSIGTISYVDCYRINIDYNYKFDGFCEKETREVSVKAPLEEKILKKSDKFQFYDIKIITLSNGKKYYSKPTNHSPIYYTGERKSLNEIEGCYIFDKSQTQPITSAIYYPWCYGNKIYLTEETEGITVEEYKQQKNSKVIETKKRVKVNKNRTNVKM